jgi:hypothetical protein
MTSTKYWPLSISWRLSEVAHYNWKDVIKFVSDLWQVSVFFCVFRFPPPVNDCPDITEILLNVVLNTLTIIRIRCGGGYGFLFRSEFFFRSTQELEYFFIVVQSAKVFFQNLTLVYMSKTLNQIFFFSSPKTYKWSHNVISRTNNVSGDRHLLHM